MNRHDFQSNRSASLALSAPSPPPVREGFKAEEAEPLP